MRVVDTSAWIEWLSQTATGLVLHPSFPDRTQHVVPTIVQLELAVWAAREIGKQGRRAIIADTLECVVVPLSTTLAVRAANIRRLHKLPTADAIVYATALAYDADLLTCDAHFEGLPHVVYIPKVIA